MQEKNEENIPNVERQGWDAEKIIEEGANENPDEVTRKILRGDETKGDPDKRDVAGSVDSENTPQGREETKLDIENSQKQD